MTDILERVESLEKRVKLIEEKLDKTPQNNIVKDVSIREFLDELKLKTQTDKVVCIGYYLPELPMN